MIWGVPLFSETAISCHLDFFKWVSVRHSKWPQGEVLWISHNFPASFTLGASIDGTWDRRIDSNALYDALVFGKALPRRRKDVQYHGLLACMSREFICTSSIWYAIIVSSGLSEIDKHPFAFGIMFFVLLFAGRFNLRKATTCLKNNTFLPGIFLETLKFFPPKQNAANPTGPEARTPKLAENLSHLESPGSHQIWPRWGRGRRCPTALWPWRFPLIPPRCLAHREIQEKNLFK